MANISISQMNTRAEANLSDLHEVAYADSNSQTGYASGKMTMEVIANAIVNGFTYQSLGNKKISKAIEDAEVTVDSELDDTSLNPIANKPVAEAIADIIGDISDIDSNIEGSKQLTTTGNVITVSDSAATYLEELEVEVEPVQDLHGYEYPWVGGAGKNLLPMTVDGIKTANTSGTWTGNVYTFNNVTFTVLTDNDNNVTGIKVNGTASATSMFNTADTLGQLNNGSNYIVNGNGTNASVDTAFLQLWNPMTQSGVANIGTSYNLQYDSTTMSSYNIVIRINNGNTANNLTFTPMLRLSTETDATYAPYSNICPISGYTECEVTRTGVNLCELKGLGYYDTTTGELIQQAGTYAYTDKIPCKQNTPYVVSSDTIYQYIIYFWDINNNYITHDVLNVGNSKVSSPNAYYMAIAVRIQTNATSLSDFGNVQLEQGTTATTYQPYQGQTYTVSFVDSQDQSMTVYSGTLDVTTGVLTVDKAMATFDGSSDESWAEYSSYNGYNIEISNMATLNYGNGLCNAFTTLSEHGHGIRFGANNNRIYIEQVTSLGATVSDWKTYLASNNLQVLYELATPQTIQLTPSQLQMLKGYNTVTTDANGGMTIKYQPDNVVGEIKAYASRLYDDILDRLEALSE